MTGIPRRTLLAAGGTVTALTAVGAAPGAASAAPASPARRTGDGTLVTGWNAELLRIVRTPGAQPATVHPTRGFAILHTAMHNAVVSAVGGRPYLFAVNADHGASPVAAAAQAAHTVLATLYPAQATRLDARLAADLDGVTDPEERIRGVGVGRLSARLLLGLRAGDGSAATPPPLAPGTAPGQYRPDPPAFAPAVFTHWPAVSPFVLDRADRFRSAPYPPLSGAAYAQATNEVADLGRNTSTTRGDDQTVQARFWAAPIWNYWNEIAQSLTLAAHLDLPRAARLFALLDLAFADAVIAFYDSKYHYLVWRPVTAIRLADTDGNPATTADPAWLPLANTPADPAYPGAHSVVAMAGVAVLADAFGPHRGFTVSSEVLPGVTRSFPGLRQAADEAGTSRIFAGVHTRLDHVAGQKLGAAIGGYTLRHAF